MEELQNAIAHLLTAQNPVSDIEGSVIEVFPTEVSISEEKRSCSVMVPQCVSCTNSQTYKVTIFLSSELKRQCQQLHSSRYHV